MNTAHLTDGANVQMMSERFAWTRDGYREWAWSDYAGKHAAPRQSAPIMGCSDLSCDHETCAAVRPQWSNLRPTEG